MLTGARPLVPAPSNRRYGFDGLCLQGPPRERLQPPRQRGQRRAQCGSESARNQIECRRPDISMIRARALQAEAVEVEGQNFSCLLGRCTWRFNDVMMWLCPSDVLQRACNARVRALASARTFVHARTRMLCSPPRGFLLTQRW